ncbi:MAG: tRNA pseudouridine(38-40) synthase TruA [Chlamydiota bacterium]|jgi:tRNA pseudouridine38-40 synthase
MYNYKLIISYDGSQYFGWQKTISGPSIEKTLQTCLTTLLQQKIILQAASRTDRGVHAYGQVVNFFAVIKIPLSTFLFRLNQLLPKDIRALSIKKVADSFHPTLDVLSKSYVYNIYNASYPSAFYHQYSWHIHENINIKKMESESKSLVGSHDFSSFTNRKEQNNVREIYSINIQQKSKNLLQITVTGNNFLYKMVRNIVGSLVYVGCRKLLCYDLLSLLKAKDRKLAGVCAPASGLFLQEIHYDQEKIYNDL